MMRSARKCVRLLPAILAAAVCLVTPDYARAGGSKDVHAPFNDGGGKTVAFVLAVTGRTEGVIPVPLEVTRETVSSQLTRTLTDQGYTVIPQKNVLELMRTWRVRDGKSIPRGFLDGLVDSLDAQLLLVANLVIQPGRMVMTARYLHPVSGIVLKVNMTESAVAPPAARVSAREVTEWITGIQKATMIAGDAHIERAGSDRKLGLMLDTQPVGCSASVALVASHALLQQFVEYGNWDLVDPGLVTSTLYDAGYSGRFLGSDARALLQKTFTCTGLMIPGFISYAPARKTRGQLEEYDESGELEEPMLSDFAMSLRLVDLTTGSITAGKEVFLAVPEHTGWFGQPRKETLMTRLRVSADQLWSDIQSTLEGF